MQRNGEEFYRFLSNRNLFLNFQVRIPSYLAFGDPLMWHFVKLAKERCSDLTMSITYHPEEPNVRYAMFAHNRLHGCHIFRITPHFIRVWERIIDGVDIAFHELHEGPLPGHALWATR